MDSIDDGVVINLITSLTTALLENLRSMLPEHNRKARAVKKVEEAIKDLAKLNALPLEPEIVQAGVAMWNKCMESLEIFLLDYQPNNCGAQMLLFIQDDTGKMFTHVDIYTPKPIPRSLDSWVKDMISEKTVKGSTCFLSEEKAIQFSNRLLPSNTPSLKRLLTEI